MCGMMRDVWCTMPEMSRLDVKYCQSVVVRCGMYRSVAIASRTSSHHYHYILHCIFPHQTPSLTLFQATHTIIGSHRIAHFISAPLAAHYSTLQYHIGLKSHPIGHIMHHTTSSGTAPHHSFHIPVPHNATFRPCTLRHISDHAIYWPHHLCIAPHLSSHHISHAHSLH